MEHHQAPAASASSTSAENNQNNQEPMTAVSANNSSSRRNSNASDDEYVLIESSESVPVTAVKQGISPSLVSAVNVSQTKLDAQYPSSTSFAPRRQPIIPTVSRISQSPYMEASYPIPAVQQQSQVHFSAAAISNFSPSSSTAPDSRQSNQSQVDHRLVRTAHSINSDEQNGEEKSPKKRKVDLDSLTDDEEEGIVINAAAVASLSHIPEILKSIIECGEDVVSSDGNRSRNYLKYNDFFGKEVEVFYALSDQLRRPLFRPHELAKKFGIHSSRIGMYLNRKRDVMVNEIYQATGFKHKSPNRMGIKVGAYFITERACRMLQRWADNRRPRVFQQDGNSSQNHVQPLPSMPSTSDVTASTYAIPINPGIRNLSQPQNNSPRSDSDPQIALASTPPSPYPPVGQMLKPPQYQQTHPILPIRSATNIPQPPPSQQDLKPYPSQPMHPYDTMSRRMSGSESGFRESEDRPSADEMEMRFRAWYAAMLAAGLPLPLEPPPPPREVRDPAAAAMAMMMDPNFYEYVLTRMRRSTASSNYVPDFVPPRTRDSFMPNYADIAAEVLLRQRAAAAASASTQMPASQPYPKQEPIDLDYYNYYKTHIDLTQSSAPSMSSNMQPQHASYTQQSYSTPRNYGVSPMGMNSMPPNSHHPNPSQQNHQAPPHPLNYPTEQQARETMNRSSGNGYPQDHHYER